MVMRTPEEALQQAEAAQRALLTGLPLAVTRSPTISPTALPAALSAADRSVTNAQTLGRDLVASLPMSPQFVQRLLGATLDANTERDFALQVAAIVNFARNLEQHPNVEQEAFLRRVVQQFPSVVQCATNLTSAGFDQNAVAGFRSVISRSLDPSSPSPQLFDSAISLATFTLEHRTAIDSDQTVKTAIQNTFANLSRTTSSTEYLATGMSATSTAVADFVRLRQNAVSEEIEHQIGQIDDLLESVRDPRLARALTQMHERLEQCNSVLTSGSELNPAQMLFVNCSRTTLNSITRLSENNLLTADISPVLVRSLELSVSGQSELSAALSSAGALICGTPTSAAVRRSFIESLLVPNVSFSTISNSFASLVTPNFPNSTLAPAFTAAITRLAQNPTLDSVARVEHLVDFGLNVRTMERLLGRDQTAVEGFNSLVNRTVTTISSSASLDLGASLTNLTRLYVSADPQTRTLILQFSARDDLTAQTLDSFNSLLNSRISLARLISHEPRSSPLYSTYQTLLTSLNTILTDQAANRQTDPQQLSRVRSALSILFSPSAQIPGIVLGQIEESQRGNFGYLGSLQNATSVICAAPASIRRQLSGFYARAINGILQNGLEGGLPLVLMAQAYAQNSTDRSAIASDLNAANGVGTPALANSASVYLDRSRAGQIRNARDRAMYLQITELELGAARRGDLSGLSIFSNLASMFFNASASNDRATLDSLRDGFVGTSGLHLPSIAQLTERYNQSPTTTLSSILLAENPQFNYNENRRASFLPESMDPNSATSRIVLIGPQEQVITLLGNDLLAQNASLEGRRLGTNPITPTTSRAFATVRRRLERLATSTTEPALAANYRRQAQLVDSAHATERAAAAARFSNQATEHFAAASRFMRASIALSGPEFDAAVAECRRRYNRSPNDLVIGYLLERAREEQVRGQMMGQAAVGLSSANQMSVNLVGSSATIPSPRGIFALERSVANFEQVAAEANSRSTFNAQFTNLQATRMQMASSDYAYGSNIHAQAVAFNQARRAFDQNATLVSNDVQATVTSLTTSGAVMRDRNVERQADGTYRVTESTSGVIDQAALNTQIERARSLARSGHLREAYAILGRVRGTRRTAAVSGIIFTTNDRLLAGASEQERQSGTMRGFDTVNLVRIRDQARADVAAGRLNEANQTLDDLAQTVIPVSESAQVRYNLANARRQLAIAYRSMAHQSESLANSSRTTGVAADTGIDNLTRNNYALARESDARALALEELAARTNTIADVVPRGTVSRILGTLEGSGPGQSLAGAAAYEQQMDELSDAIAQNGEAGGMRYLTAHPELLNRGLRLMRENGDLSQNASDQITAEVEHNQAIVRFQQNQRVQGFVSTVFSTEVQMVNDIEALGRARRAAPIERDAYRTNATSFGHLAADAIADPASFERRIESGEVPSQFNHLLENHLDTLQSITLGRLADRRTGVPIARDEAIVVARAHTQLTFASLGYASDSEGAQYHRIYLDQERQRQLGRTLEISQRNIGQFTTISTTLSPGLSPTRLSLAGDFSRSDAVSAYQNTSESAAQLRQSFTIITRNTSSSSTPARALSASEQSQLDNHAVDARGRLYDSTGAVESGTSTERNVSRVGMAVDIVGAGLLSASGFGAPVAFYFLTQSSVGFLDQAVAAGGVENMSELQLAVGGLGIGLALLGLGANGLGALASELNAEVQATTRLGMDATRLTTSLLGVNRASLLLGRTMMVGGALVGVGSAYEMHLHDPNANLFDYGLTFFNAAQPGLLHGFQLAGMARPNLILGNTFGARAYRLGMMMFFGTGRQQMIEQYNARLSTEVGRMVESLTPEQRANYQTALGTLGDSASLQTQRELLDFMKANPDHPAVNDPTQLALLARAYHSAGERAIYGLTPEAHVRIHEVELELGRELSPGERTYVASQMPREGALPTVESIVNDLQSSQPIIPGVDTYLANQRSAYEQTRTQMAGAVTEGGMRTAPVVATPEAVNAAAAAQTILSNHNSTPGVRAGSSPSAAQVASACAAMGVPELAPVVSLLLADSGFKGVSGSTSSPSQQLPIAQWATDFYNTPIPGIELSPNDRARIVHAVIAASAEVSGPLDIARVMVNLGHSPYEPGFDALVGQVAQIAADPAFRSAPSTERIGLMYAHLQGEGTVVAERVTGPAVRTEAPRVGARLDRLRRLAAERAVSGPQVAANDQSAQAQPVAPVLGQERFAARRDQVEAERTQTAPVVSPVVSLGLTDPRALTTFIRDVSLGNPTANENLASMSPEVQQAVRDFIANPLFRSPRNRNSTAGRAAIARLAETIERLTTPREPTPQQQRQAVGAPPVDVVGGRIEVAPPLRAVPNQEAPVAMHGESATPNFRPQRRGPTPVSRPLDEGTAPATGRVSERPVSQRPRPVTGGVEDVFANAPARVSTGETNRAVSPITIDSENTTGNVQAGERPVAPRVNAPIANDSEHITRINQLLDNPEAATQMRAMQDESYTITDPTERLAFIHSPEFRARAVAALGSERAAESFVDLLVRCNTSGRFNDAFYYLLRETNPLLRSRLFDAMLNYEQTRGSVVGPTNSSTETQSRLDRYSPTLSAAYRTSLSTDGATTATNAAAAWGLDPVPIGEAARDANLNALRTELRDQLQAVRADTIAAAGNGRNADMQSGLSRLPDAARAHLIGEYNRAGVEEVARTANLNERAKAELQNAMINLNGASFDDLIPVLQRHGINDPAQVESLRRTYIGAGTAGMLRAVDGIVETICGAYELTGLTGFLRSQGIEFTPPTIPERALAATRSLADLVAIGNLEQNVRNIPGFENATITGARYRHGLRGAFALETSVTQPDGSVRQRRLYLKMEDLAAARFGEQLLRAEGILTANHYTGLSYESGRTCINGRPEVIQYGLIEDIHDLIGTQQTVRLPDGRIETVTVRSVGLVNDEIAGPVGHIVGDPNHQAHEVTTQFYTQLGTEDGRVALFDAWASYHQGSRNALLMDRAGRNSIAAVVELPDGSRQLVFGAIDTDAITERIEPIMNNGAHAGNDLTTFNRDFTNVTNELTWALPSHVSDYNANVPAAQRINVTEFDIARSVGAVAQRPAPPATYTPEMIAARTAAVHDYNGGNIGFANTDHGVSSWDNGFSPRPRRQDGRSAIYEDEFHALHGQVTSPEGEAAYQRARVDGADCGQFSALLRGLRTNFPQVHDNFVAVVNYLYAGEATHRVGYGTNHRQDPYNNLGYLLAEGRYVSPEIVAQRIANTTPILVSAGVMTSEQAAAMQPTYQNLVRVVVERAVIEGSVTREQADNFFNTARQLTMRTGLDMFDPSVRGAPTSIAPPVVNISAPVDNTATTPAAVRGTATTPAQDPNGPVAAPRVNVAPRVSEPTTIQDQTQPNPSSGQPRPVSRPSTEESVTPAMRRNAVSVEPATAPRRSTPAAVEEHTRLDIPLPPADETTRPNARAEVRTSTFEATSETTGTRMATAGENLLASERARIDEIEQSTAALRASGLVPIGNAPVQGSDGASYYQFNLENPFGLSLVWAVPESHMTGADTRIDSPVLRQAQSSVAAISRNPQNPTLWEDVFRIFPAGHELENAIEHLPAETRVIARAVDAAARSNVPLDSLPPEYRTSVAAARDRITYMRSLNEVANDHSLADAPRQRAAERAVEVNSTTNRDIVSAAEGITALRNPETSGPAAVALGRWVRSASQRNIDEASANAVATVIREQVRTIQDLNHEPTFADRDIMASAVSYANQHSCPLDVALTSVMTRLFDSAYRVINSPSRMTPVAQSLRERIILNMSREGTSRPSVSAINAAIMEVSARHYEATVIPRIANDIAEPSGSNYVAAVREYMDLSEPARQTVEGTLRTRVGQLREQARGLNASGDVAGAMFVNQSCRTLEMRLAVISERNAVLGPVGAEIERAYGMTRGALADIYRSNASNDTAREELAVRLDLRVDPADDELFGMLLSGNLLGWIGRTYPHPESVHIENIGGGATGAYRIQVVDSDGRVFSEYVKRVDMRADEAGYHNLTISGVPASEVIAYQPGSNRPLEYVDSQGRTNNYGISRGIDRFDGNIVIGRHNLHLTASDSVALNQVHENPAMIDILTNHRDLFWRELGYLNAAHFATGAIDGHAANIRAMTLTINNPDPAVINDLTARGYSVFREADGTHKIFMLARIDTDDSGGTYWANFDNGRLDFTALQNWTSNTHVYPRLFASLSLSINTHLAATAAAGTTPSFVSPRLLAQETYVSPDSAFNAGARRWFNDVGSRPDYQQAMVDGFRAREGQPIGVSSFARTMSDWDCARIEGGQIAFPSNLYPSNGDPTVPIFSLDARSRALSAYELVDVNSTYPLFASNFHHDTTTFVVRIDGNRLPSGATASMPLGGGSFVAFFPSIDSIPEALRSNAVYATRYGDHIRAGIGFGNVFGIRSDIVSPANVFGGIMNAGSSFIEGQLRAMSYNYSVQEAAQEHHALDSGNPSAAESFLDARIPRVVSTAFPR